MTRKPVALPPFSEPWRGARRWLKRVRDAALLRSP